MVPGPSIACILTNITQGFPMRYHKLILNQMVQSYKAANLAVIKKAETFWVRGYFLASLHSKSLLSGRPGFDPRTLQTLRAHNFVAPWSKRS